MSPQYFLYNNIYLFKYAVLDRNFARIQWQFYISRSEACKETHKPSLNQQTLNTDTPTTPRQVSTPAS